MVTSEHTSKTSLFDSHVDWIEYYTKLCSHARHFVYMYRVPCWYGQEEDIAEDVVQETMRRMIEYIHKSVQGKAKPVDSPEHMMVVIARNYVLDMRRHDRRITRISDNDGRTLETTTSKPEHVSEIAIEHVYLEWLFLQVAYEIKQLPRKQRRAILTDLANRMSFNRKPTPLQGAFLTVGIDLQDYQQSLPESPVERARHAALLSLAYKRIAQRFKVNQFLTVA